MTTRDNDDRNVPDSWATSIARWDRSAATRKSMPCANRDCFHLAERHTFKEPSSNLCPSCKADTPAGAA